VGCGRLGGIKTTVQAQLPQELVARARAFVEEGWAADFDALLAESLRRYRASHSGKFAESSFTRT